jgi:hypothetical protein
MLAKKFQHLINGGGKQAGVDGLRAEIKALETERASHAAELNDIPDRRSELLLADDHNEAVNKLEDREKELFRLIDRIDLQASALRERLPQQQGIKYRDLVEHHRSALALATAAFEEAMIAAVAANEAMAAARQAGVDDLGFDSANNFLPLVHFAGLIDNRCLEAWRSRQKDQSERAAQRPAVPFVPVVHRSPFVSWENNAGGR